MRGISRRVRTLIVAGAVFLALLVVSMTLPVPYVVLAPGLTCDTLSTCENQTVVNVVGLKKDTTGALYLTTVNYTTDSLTIFDALSAWLQDDKVVVPRSALFPPGQTTDQVNTQNKAEFANSQNSAIVAASCQLGFFKAFGVVGLTDKSPSKGKLRAGDAFVSLDGKPANTRDKLKAALAGEKPGARVDIVVKRQQGGERTETIALGKPLQGSKGASLGVETNVEPSCLAPYQINLGLGDDIGGPSAGLMFALGIMDKLGTNLTFGRTIAGTGTIDDAGEVGPIGGIQLKMIGAKRSGATVFLAPAGNCSDVKGAIPSGLQVIKVDTLAHAVQYLKDSHAGKSVPSC